MTTNPNPLDILDSQLSPHDYQQYLTKLSQVQSGKAHWKFEIVPNQFKQSLSSTDESKFDYLNQDFGRIGSWDDIVKTLQELNAAAAATTTTTTTCYKIVFLARHGQGFHNLAHCKYGDDAWNDYWSKLNGDGEIIWGPDPELTNLGINQAKDNNYVWKQQLKQNHNIVPKQFYSSPLSRSIDTLIYTWNDIVDLKSTKPLIMENLRETMGVHTCDKRSPKSTLVEKYPNFIIEPNFEQEDIYWQKDYRESVVEHGLRINQAFQTIFDNSNEDIISITSHSGSIRASLLVLGHRSFAVGTGGMIPVFVKATKVDGE